MALNAESLTYHMRTQIPGFHKEPERWWLFIFPSSNSDTLTPSSSHTANASVDTFLQNGRSSSSLFLRLLKALLSFKFSWKISSMDTGPAITSFPGTSLVLQANIISKPHDELPKSNICMRLFLKQGSVCIHRRQEKPHIHYGHPPLDSKDLGEMLC